MRRSSASSTRWPATLCAPTACDRTSHSARLQLLDRAGLTTGERRSCSGSTRSTSGINNYLLVLVPNELPWRSPPRAPDRHLQHASPRHLFVDHGPTHYVQRRRDLIAKRSVRRLEELGFKESASYAGVLQPLYCAWPA